MFTALALAAIIVTNPAACPSGMWATPAGEAGYVCSAAAPPSETWWLPQPPAPVHHAAPVKHHPVKHHHSKPRHHAKKASHR